MEATGSCRMEVQTGQELNEGTFPRTANSLTQQLVLHLLAGQTWLDELFPLSAQRVRGRGEGGAGKERRGKGPSN